MIDSETILYSTPPRSSQRMGGVWVDNMSRSQKDVSGTKSTEARAKRIEASEWMCSMTGTSVPHGGDLEFRAALRDGIVLCKVLNVVCPGAVVKVWESPDPARSATSQRYENVTNFLAALAGMGVPPLCTFSCTDLESESSEDRVRVADCILWLKRLHEGVNPLAPHSPLSPSLSLMVGAAPVEQSDVIPGRDVRTISPSFGSPLKSLTLSPAKLASPVFEFKAGHQPDMLQAKGVSQLMQQCSSMLAEQHSTVSSTSSTSRANSSSSSSSSMTTMTTTKSTSMQRNSMETGTDFNFEAVGPVLESVLGNLTQEYERRLLLKDQEIIATKEKMSGLARQMVEMQNQITSMRAELMTQREEAEAAASVMSSEQVAELEGAVEKLRAELEDREERLRELNDGVQEEAGQVAIRSQQLAAELEAMREQLAGVDRLEEMYRAVQEDNKRLYNTVQDLKGSIRVFCRVRPLGITGDPGSSCLNVDVEGDEVALYESSGKLGRKLFKFDRIFDDSSTQEEVYSDAQQLIRCVLDGYNVCIFAYGQTGAGKTHTMTGSNVSDERGRGINYRALHDLFELRQKRMDEVEYTIRVQMLEIYNETLRDLLSEDQSHSGNRLDILNTQASGCNVPNAVQMEVCCPEDVMSFMQRGARNRHSAETKMNERSSRSHQILTVIVDGFNKLTHARSHGCLHLVDLAGSERVGKSEASGDRLIEAQHINRSLSALGDVMAALASKEKHVPFRNSKLTQLLADSLSGQAKVMMFMHASPEASSHMETLSTLKFATRVSEVTLGAAKKNVECSKAIMAEEEVVRLREEVASTRERLGEEAKQKMALQREVEQLRAALESMRRPGASCPDPQRSVGGAAAPGSPWGSDDGDEGVSGFARSEAEPATSITASHRTPPTSSMMNLKLSEALSRHGEGIGAASTPKASATPRSSRYGSSYSLRRSSSITPATVNDAPPVPTPRSRGSYTSRAGYTKTTPPSVNVPPLNVSRTAASCRSGSTYAGPSSLPRPLPSPSGPSYSRQLSSRTSGVHASSGSFTARSSTREPLNLNCTSSRRSFGGGWK